MKGRKIDVKRILKRFGILIMLGGVLFMTGCKSEMEKTIEETLYQKYGEEFEVHYVMAAGQVFTAECSPVDNEEIIFDVRIEDDETPGAS